MSDSTEPIAGGGNGRADPVDERVVDVHRKQLQNHRFVQEYETVGEYFEQERGLEDVADEYYDVPAHAAFRIHTHAPRDYLLLQSNPELRDGVATESVHWSYEELSGGLDESVRENVLHSSQTITTYLNDTGTARWGVKSIIDAVQSELGCSFEGNALRQADYEEYLQVAAARAYKRCPKEEEGADIDAGFHGDFAYSNRYKFQVDGSIEDHEPEEDNDDDWLECELSMISPKVVFALGDTAYDGLKECGFKKTDKQSDYSNFKTGRVLCYDGDRSELDGTYAVHLYHLSNSSNLTTDLDVHEALAILKEVADSI